MANGPISEADSTALHDLLVTGLLFHLPYLKSATQAQQQKEPGPDHIGDRMRHLHVSTVRNSCVIA